MRASEGDGKTVQLGHGGGAMTQRLIESVFLPAFGDPARHARHDGAVLEASGARLAFTTDSFVVRPLEFPGGDIGTLAVDGTVNDLAMCGARPRWLSAGFILEEGLPLELLSRIVRSMRRAADEAGVEIVTGDTKVVEHGRGDGMYVNTAGVGLIAHGLRIEPASVRPGDAVLVSGDVGRHGIAVLAVREGLAFESAIESDCAPVSAPVQALLDAGLEIHCLRDLTRGGLAAALVEIAQSGRVEVRGEENAIPVRDDVRGACEILGLDPLYVANEGRFVAFLPEAQAGAALERLGPEARRIGTVGAATPGRVVLRTPIGATRIVDLPSGEQLPRIC